MPIYVHHNNKQLGPYSAADVRTQLASGAISAQDLVWWQGQKSWVPLGKSAVISDDFRETSGKGPKPPQPLTGVAPKAVGALACAIFSPFFLVVASVPAIILGHQALKEIRNNPGRKGRGLAITGLVIGYTITLVVIVVATSYYLLQPGIATVAQEEELKQQAFTPALPPVVVVPSPAHPPPSLKTTPQISLPPPVPSPAKTVVTPPPQSAPVPAPTAMPVPIGMPNPTTNGSPAVESPASDTANAIPSQTNPQAKTNAAPLN